MRTPMVMSLSFGAALAACLVARDARAACSKIECGTNSPYLAQYDFHELNFEGLPNDEGLIVTGLESPLWWWSQLYPRVDRDRLLAVDSSGEIILKGDALVGASITVIDSLAEPTKYVLTIEAVYGHFDLWVDPNGEELESYKLSWREAGMAPQNSRALCTQPPPQIIGDGQEWYPDPDGTILYTGDRYSSEKKTIVATGFEETRGWVNFACPAGALYKSFTTRHTKASSDHDHEASLAENQAMLKLYVADVCGDGTSFTEQGTPLHWTNPAGWGYVTWSEFDTEAYWSAEGALCLNVHRLGSTFAAEIAQHCQLPSCDTLFPDAPHQWPEKAALVSRVPLDPM